MKEDRRRLPKVCATHTKGAMNYVVLKGDEDLRRRGGYGSQAKRMSPCRKGIRNKILERGTVVGI